MERTSSYTLTSVVTLAVLVSATIFVGAAAAQPAVPTEPTENKTADTVQRLVNFESDDVNGAAVDKNTSVSVLQQRAAITQKPLVTHASKNPALTIEKRFWITSAALVTVNTSRMAPSELTTIDNVDQVTPNFRVEATAASQTVPQTSSATSSQTNSTTAPKNEAQAEVPATYGLKQTHTTEAWNKYDTRGNNVRVAVLDTGVDPDHPDIQLADSKSWAEWDGVGRPIETSPQDYSPKSHGTHVSGTVSGGDAGGEYIGVAPKTELMVGAVLTQCDNSCYGTGAQILSGMEWAVNNDAEVLSMSLGAKGYYKAYADAVINAEESGTLVVAASGNQGEGTSISPANVYPAVAVGATNQYKEVPAFSSGERITTDVAWDTPPEAWPDRYVVPDIVAPGNNVYSATKGGNYQFLSGTSMAAPHVAGIAALMESATEDDLTPDEIKAGLYDTTRDINVERTRSGRGLVTADSAIAAVAGQAERDVGYYAGDNGRISTRELFEAIDDWRDEQISDTLIQEVISYWRSGDVVANANSPTSSSRAGATS